MALSSRHTLMRQDRGYVNPREYGATLDHTTLQAAITAIGSTPAGLLLTPGTWTIGAHLTIPAHVTLVRSRGAMLSISSPFIVTLNGDQEGPLSQWITGAGTVVFGDKVTEVSPQWWGAVADGVTDNTPAFVAACAALSASGGGRLSLSAGTYLLANVNSTPILIPSHTEVCGHGPRSVLKLAAGSVNFSRILQVKQATQVSLHDFAIDGNGDNVAAGEQSHSIFVWASTHVRIERMTLSKAQGDGIATFSDALGLCEHITCRHNRIYDLGRQGIAVTGTGINTFRAEGNTIIAGTRSTATTPASYGNAIHAEPTVAATNTDWQILDNMCLGVGISVAHNTGGGLVRRVRVVGNEITCDLGAGITVTETQDLLIEGNLLQMGGTSTTGIIMTDASGVGGTGHAIIRGNIVLNALSQSIVVTGSGGGIPTFGTNIIADNQIHNGAGDGILINAATPRLHIINNLINVLSSGFGIHAKNVSRFLIAGNTLIDTGTIGIAVVGSGGVATEGRMYGNKVSFTTAGTGLSLTNSVNVSRIIYFGNDFADAATPVNSHPSATGIVGFRNLGHITEAQGTGTILAAATSASITHGLKYTPTAAEITVTLTANPTAAITALWVSGITATVFVVNCEPAPGSDLGFSWAARKV